MHRLKKMKEELMCCVQAQMNDLSQVDTKELGEAIDMIKDLSEAMYYHAITEAMEEHEKTKRSGTDKHHGDWDTKDCREGKSPRCRKLYMEAKEMHHDKTKQMVDLENYLHELSQDIMEMIQDASPEEKQLLQQKISTLAGKIK